MQAACQRVCRQLTSLYAGMHTFAYFCIFAPVHWLTSVCHRSWKGASLSPLVSAGVHFQHYTGCCCFWFSLLYSSIAPPVPPRTVQIWFVPWSHARRIWWLSLSQQPPTEQALRPQVRPALHSFCQLLHFSVPSPLFCPQAPWKSHSTRMLSWAGTASWCV